MRGTLAVDPRSTRRPIPAGAIRNDRRHGSGGSTASVPHPVALAGFAPRLARARDQQVAYLRECSRIELAIAGHRLELQRLVAHRELQLVRAFHTRNSRYIARRQRLLESARRRLAGLESAAAAQEKAA